MPTRVAFTTEPRLSLSLYLSLLLPLPLHLCLFPFLSSFSLSLSMSSSLSARVPVPNLRRLILLFLCTTMHSILLFLCTTMHSMQAFAVLRGCRLRNCVTSAGAPIEAKLQDHLRTFQDHLRTSKKTIWASMRNQRRIPDKFYSVGFDVLAIVRRLRLCGSCR